MYIYGIITTTNSNDDNINLVIKNQNDEIFNVKTTKEISDSLKRNHVYRFNVLEHDGSRLSYHLIDYLDVSSINTAEREEILRGFMPHKERTLKENDDIIEDYIAKIDYEVLKAITVKLYDKNKIDLLTYPGGVRIHHAYLGGLSQHLIGMLKLADSFLEIYPFLDKNYLYSGIILHDLGKIYEYSDVQNPYYDVPGQMLGHLVIGAMEVSKAALELGYEKTEEAMILEHILISHHGQLQFGSCKKPITAEALIIWFIDTIDSKFSVLETELEKTLPGEFTETIPVLDKVKMYKPKNR